MPELTRDGVRLAFDDEGSGSPPLVFVHGIGSNARFWSPQVKHFRRRHRVLAVDLRGHARSDSPEQPYTIRGFADDLAWVCAELALERPVVIGHSLGGLVALELAATRSAAVAAAALIDSVLLPGADRAEVVEELIAALRGEAPAAALRAYFEHFFTQDDDSASTAWVLDEAAKTPPHVTSSIWEESLRTWDDAAALRRCGVPLLYLDAGTPNCDLGRAVQLNANLIIGRTIGSGHFSPLAVPDQVNSMLERFIELYGQGAR